MTWGREKVHNPYMSLFRKIIGLVLIAPLLVSVAKGEVCIQSSPSDPNPEVSKQVSSMNCAVKNDFKSSCAYREWVSGRTSLGIEKDAAAYADRVSRVLDPKCDPEKNPANPCGLDAREGELLRTLASADFKEFYRRFTNGSPDGKYSENSLRSGGFDQTKINRYKQTLATLDSIDPIGAVKSSFLLSLGVDSADKAFTSTDKKKIIEKVALDGYKFKASKLEGCSRVKAEVRYRLANVHAYGPIRHGAGPADVTQKQIGEFNAKSDTEAKGNRSIEGVTDELKSCGSAFSAPYAAVAQIQSQCSVNLPVEVFSDNVSALATTSQNAMMAALESDECFKKGKAAGLPIARIAIATSANTLHNTKNYCRWEFDRLSADRGAMIKSGVSNGLGDRLGSAEFQVDSSGDRGDGSSGPCAYAAKEWKSVLAAPKGSTMYEVKTSDGATHFLTEERHPDFSSPTEEKTLDQYKYARATVFYAEKTAPITANDFQQKSGTSCRHVEFSCKE